MPIQPRNVPSHLTSSSEHNTKQVSEPAIDTHPIEGSIPVSRLRFSVGRLLMQAATALGLESNSSGNSANNQPSGETSGIAQKNRLGLFVEQLARNLVESRFIRVIVGVSGTALNFASMLWRCFTHVNEEQVSYRPLRDTALEARPTNPSQLFPYGSFMNDEGYRETADRIVDTEAKNRDIFVEAMGEGAEAERREEQEKREEKEQHAARELRERLGHARSIIEAIDARGGTNANNPRVQAVLASLGTPYDSIQHAIALVEALQAQEIEDESQRRG